MMKLWRSSHIGIKKLKDYLSYYPDYLAIVIPYIWLLIFFFIPFLIIFKISFSQPAFSIPPFDNLFHWIDQYSLQVQFHFSNYIVLFKDPFYRGAFWSSIKIASSATLICLTVGYLTAYAIVRTSSQWRIVLLLLVLLPFWTSFLIRVYAWMSLLSTKGILNVVLLKMGFITEPLQFLDNSYAVCLGITYCYLPFMVLPIYSALEKIDPVYWEAAYDLGAGLWKTFWKITVPLSKTGIIAGCILVFIPAMGEFVIPELLGGPSTFMIGRVLWMEFFNNQDWPQSCALAVVMMILFVVPIMIVQNYQQSHLKSNES